MTRRAASVAVAMLFLALVPAGAQTPENDTTAAIEPEFFEVNGLSPGDDLNLRANASPTGMMIGRMPQGSVVRNLGCAEVGKHRWCKIADVNKDSLQGWAAARYLVETQYDEPEPLDPTDAPEGEPGETGDYPDIDNSGASILPD